MSHFATARHIRIAVAPALAVFLAACGSDSVITSPPEEMASLCHLPTSAAVAVPLSEVSTHTAHGDYFTKLMVSPASPASTDGMHFSRITSALASVRAGRIARGETAAARCRVEIKVAAGEYRGTLAPASDPLLEQFPLIIDVPQVTLLGALVMPLDVKNRPTAGVASAPQSSLTPTTGMKGDADALIVVNGHPDNSSAGNGAVIEGFVFRSGHVGVDADTGGYGVFAMRVRDLVVRGNRFEAALTNVVDLRATSATVTRNYFMGAGLGCEICAAGPGSFKITDNFIAKGGIDGILLSAATILAVPPSVEQYVAPAAAAETSVVTNNEVRDHLRKPVGVGIRIATVGLGIPNAPQTNVADIRDNVLVNNTFGFLLEAGFPVAGSAATATMNVTIKGNTVSQSCQADLFLSFNRHATTLGLAQLTRPYLRNSTYRIDMAGDIASDKYWFAHPADLGNVLVIDGVTMPTGIRTSYDAARTCS